MKNISPLPPRIRVKSKILEIRDLTPTVKEFVFAVPSDFFFYAGQFITLRFDIDGRTVGRPYSIASSPQLKDRVDICIKLVEDGLVTPRLFNTQYSEIDLAGPMGRFFLQPQHQDHDLVFIGTGTGVAPLKSMIENLFHQGFKYSIKLLFGVRYVSEILYQNLWNSLLEKHANFEYHQVVSRPENESYSEKKGRVGDHLADLILPHQKQLFIVCGLKAMIDSVTQILTEHNVPKENILCEKYD